MSSGSFHGWGWYQTQDKIKIRLRAIRRLWGIALLVSNSIAAVPGKRNVRDGDVRTQQSVRRVRSGLCATLHGVRITRTTNVCVCFGSSDKKDETLVDGMLGEMHHTEAACARRIQAIADSDDVE